MATLKKQAGFTLIELMIVVAIISILTSIALPAFRDYTVRARVSEVIILARRDTDLLREYFHLNGALPAQPADAGVVVAAARSSYLTADTTISWDGTVAEVVYSIGNMGGDAEGDVQYTGTAAGSDLKWTCATIDFPDKYLPEFCR